MRLDIPMCTEWNTCEHVWECRGDFDLGAEREVVVCVRCGAPGERNMKTGETDWPCT